MKVLFSGLKTSALLLVLSFSHTSSIYARFDTASRVVLTAVPSSEAATFAKKILASPLLYPSPSKTQLVVAASNGVVALIDAESMTLDWEISVPVAPEQTPELAATPVRVGDKLVAVYHAVKNGARVSERLVVIDLFSRRIDETFPVLEFAAEKPSVDGRMVKFNPQTAYAHSALQHMPKKDGGLGVVYVSFGNAGDVQPFHGWLFEIDLDKWRQFGPKAAATSSLLTTPEPECPVTLEYGTQEMICGGGVWTPSGPQLYPSGDGYELFVPTGNGQIDLTRRDYANTLMRLMPGLSFDPGCDENLCADFNPSEPSTACIQSCKNLFIPRLAPGNAPLKPANGQCDTKSYWDCLAWMDYDLGANAPVKAHLPSGRSVVVQGGKDGGVSLLDADHLGTQYDRIQIADVCGTADDRCMLSWAGMMVTRPVLSYLDATPMVAMPFFMPDHSHAAGVIALKIVDDGGAPKFVRAWQFPDPNSGEAKSIFRFHPSLPAIAPIGDAGDEVLWVVDVGHPGTLYGIRARDGQLMTTTALQGTGQSMTAPLVYRNTVYVTSYLSESSQAVIEAFKIEASE